MVSSSDYQEVQAEKSPMMLVAQNCDMVEDRFNTSVNNNSKQFQRFSRFYEVWRGIYQGKYHPFRNNITVPLLYATVQSDVARKLSMLMGGFPYVSFVGGGPEDQVVARRQEALVNVQMYDCRTYEKLVDLFTMSDIYGVAPFRWFWRKQEGELTLRADFGNGEELLTNSVTKFNGPDWEPIDVLDFFPAPGYPKLRDMPWVVHRYWMDIEEVKQYAELGIFDRKQVAQLGFAPPQPDILQALQFRRSMISGGLIESKTRGFDKMSKPVEILEMWGKVPRNLVPKGESQMRVVTVANRKFLMRNRENPYRRQTLPFGCYTPNPDPHQFYSAGKVEIAERLQYASNRIANQKMDALDRFIDPIFLANRRSGLDVRNMRLRPGGVLWADGEVGDSMIRPLFPDLRGLSTAYQELEQQDRWIQKGTGITEDTVQGFSAGDRVTASEFQGRQEAVSNRILNEVRLAEVMVMEELANVFVDLNRQFLPFPQMVRMIGAQAVLDPMTLQPIPQDPIEVTVNDMLPDYDKRAMGATRTIGKQAMSQNLLTAIQVIQSNPLGMQMVNWMSLYRALFMSMDLPNVDALLNTQNLMLQAVQMAMSQGQQGQGGGADGAVGSEAGQAANPLAMVNQPGSMMNPQMLQQMLGAAGGQNAQASGNAGGS